MRDIKRLLITRTDRLGDVVLSTPVIRYFRANYPDAHIAFMVRPENVDVVLNNPDLNEVIVYDKYGLQKSFFATVKFGWKLRKKQFDTAIALHPTNRAHMLLFLSGAKNRIGYDRKMRYLLSEKYPHNKQQGKKHEADYNFDLLRDAGFDILNEDRLPYISISEDIKQKVSEKIDRAGLTGKSIAVLHVGASCVSKRWPVERFAEAADEIINKFSLSVVYVGGKETAFFSSDSISNMKNKALDLTGKLTVMELSELISRAKVFISNDSGPVHVAAAVGTPSVVIFGRKDQGLSPKRWGPLGLMDKIIHKDAGCTDCLAHNCMKDFACIKAVLTEDVVQSLSEILNKIQLDSG